jgi:hypothetical protein
MIINTVLITLKKIKIELKRVTIRSLRFVSFEYHALTISLAMLPSDYIISHFERLPNLARFPTSSQANSISCLLLPDFMRHALCKRNVPGHRLQQKRRKLPG